MNSKCSQFDQTNEQIQCFDIFVCEVYVSLCIGCIPFSMRDCNIFGMRRREKEIGWWNENYVIMYDKQNMCMFRCYLISGVENCSGWDVWAGWTLNTWAFCRCSRLTLLLFGARFDLIVVITIPFFFSLAPYLFLNSLRHSFAPRQFFFPFLYNVNLRSLSDPHYIWEATCSQAVWRKISCSAIPHCASLYFDALVLYSFCSSGRFYRSLCILTLLFCSRILLYISLSLSISYWFVFVEFVRFYFHFLCLDFENLRKEITL